MFEFTKFANRRTSWFRWQSDAEPSAPDRLRIFVGGGRRFRCDPGHAVRLVAAQTHLGWLELPTPALEHVDAGGAKIHWEVQALQSTDLVDLSEQIRLRSVQALAGGGRRPARPIEV